MKKLLSGLMLILLSMGFPLILNAAVINYSGNETGFISAVQGLGVGITTIDLEDLTQGDVLTNQYASQNLLFSTYPGQDITIEDNCHGPAPHSGVNAAESWYDPTLVSYFTIEFVQPSYGASLWVGDINNGLYVNVEVFDIASQSLGTFQVIRAGDWTNVAMFSDLKDIGSIVITASGTGDGIGFDDVKTATVPIPSAVWLLGSAFIGLVGFRNKIRKA